MTNATARGLPTGGDAVPGAPDAPPAGRRRAPKRSLYGWLKGIYYDAKDVYSFLRKEIELNGIPLGAAKMRYLATGSHSDKRHLYDSGADGLPDARYIRDMERLKTKRLNRGYKFVLDDKISFSQVFQDLCPVPVHYGFTDARGRFCALQADVMLDGSHPLEALRALPSPVVLKPAGGGGGRNIHIVETGGDGWLINGKATTPAAVETAIAGRRVLFCQLIGQGAYARDLYPRSVNTVRIMTINDGRAPPWIPFAVQRIGRKESAPTDNFNRGGMCALVDPETGTLGEALYYSGSERPKAFAAHPDTGRPIAGCRIPGWQGIKADMIRLVDRFPGFVYVGWDIVLRDDGFLLLEGNSYPGVQVIQLHRPLLDIGGMADFYRAAGILRRRPA